jgi:hypothetical protein
LLSLLATLASPTFTGTVTMPAPTFNNITGSIQCLKVSAAGVVSGTGSLCSGYTAVAPLAFSGTAFSLQNSTPANITNVYGTDTSFYTGSNGPATTGDIITGDAQGGIKDSGTLLSSLAPKASPTFTGTVTLPAATATSIGSATNCASAASPAACGSAIAGRVVIAAAATTVVVDTTAVTANSEIFVQEDTTLGTALSVTCNTANVTPTPYISARTANTSFTITETGSVSTNPLCLTYFIVN